MGVSMNTFFKSFFAIIGVFTVLIFALIVWSIFTKMGGMGEESLAHLVDKDENQIGVVELEGEIVSSKDFREKIFKFTSNKSIQAIVVRIDSPGGAVGASEEIYRYIKEARKKKPVICSLGNIAASGGLYSAMGCEKVVTSAGTMSGSIGVIMMSPNFTAVMEKVGVSFNIIKTGQYKDSGTPFRELKEEDKEYLNGVAQMAFAQFVNAIATSRNLSEESVKRIADGRIILGEEAVKLGIADSIGGLYDAARIALELALGDKAKDKEPKLVFPTKDFNVSELLKTVQQQSKAVFNNLGHSETSIKYQM
jgi:protease-4